MSQRAKPRAGLLRSAIAGSLFFAGCGGGGGNIGGSSTNVPSVAPSVTPTPAASSPPALPAAAAMLGSCRAFPADNPWNTDISSYPVDPNSANYLNEMNPSGSIDLHPDFGSNPTYGIPINIVSIVPANFTPITFTGYPSESDPGPYPIPASPAIESGSDMHMLIVDNDNCKLYETFATTGSSAAGWTASNGALFDLSSDALRPEGWTSADAAGLPIAAGLVRFSEVQAGAINHAVRFTLPKTTAGHIHPATHDAETSSDQWAAPMGLRLRLKASYNLSGFHGESLVVLTALKRYGMILADNGSPFYITGETNTGWDDNDLDQMKTVPGSAFEVVTTGAVLP